MNDQELEQYIRKEYETNKKSFAVIAKELDTYQNWVLRKAKRFNIPIRDKSAAQSLALESGRQAHPTKGMVRDEATKNKIGKSVSENWECLNDTEREHRSQIGKDSWDKKSEFEKKKLLKQAGEAIRKTSKVGSKLEQYLARGLTKAGYVVELHKMRVVANEKIHFDLFFPQNNIVCEINGIGHTKAVWGEEKLLQTKISDSKKVGLVLGRGLVMIVINQTKYISKTYMQSVFDKLLPIVEDVVKQFPPPEERYIVIEV